jgi:hypothetical protein
VQFVYLSPCGGITRVKLGCITMYVLSVMLTAWSRIMSVVAPALFSRVSIIAGFWLTLWDMILMFATSGLYLFMGCHISVGIGGGVGGYYRSGLLPGFSDDYALDWAVHAEGGMIGRGLASGGTVVAFVVDMGAGLTLAVRAVWALVLVGGVVLCAEATDGSSVGFAAGMVVSELLVPKALVSLVGREVFCHSSGFEEHCNHIALQGVRFCLHADGDDYAGSHFVDALLRV